MSMEEKIKKGVRELLKEAHDHGYGIAASNLDWTIEKSYSEFLKQNNIPLVSAEEIKKQEAVKAKQMAANGFTLREIAATLGYGHPQSISNLIKKYT